MMSIGLSRAYRRIVSCASALFLILVLSAVRAPTAQAQQSKGGASHLDAVEISGSKKFSSQQIAAAVGLRAGNIITREDLQAAADKLAGLGARDLRRFRCHYRRRYIR
jgi:cell division septal protein FtsQ